MLRFVMLVANKCEFAIRWLIFDVDTIHPSIHFVPFYCRKRFARKCNATSLRMPEKPSINENYECTRTHKHTRAHTFTLISAIWHGKRFPIWRHTDHERILHVCVWHVRFSFFSSSFFFLLPALLTHSVTSTEEENSHNKIDLSLLNEEVFFFFCGK